MNSVPEDPMMLLSVLNTKLRDYYASLDELCEDMGLEKEAIINKMQIIQYVYNEELNKFV